MKKQTSVEQITSHEAAMSDGTVRPTRFYRGQLTPDSREEEQFAAAATAERREKLVSYIQAQLGPDLCTSQLDESMTYSDAINSSVETGCYDEEIGRGDLTRVTKYIDGLRETFRRAQGDCSKQVTRLLHLRRFGTEAEKAMLHKLGLD